MTDEETKVAESEDDAIVVTDPVAAEEKADAELTDKVAKLLGQEETPDEKSEEPGKEPEDTASDGETEEAAEFSESLKARAQGAGLTDDLAQQLHQSGQLGETLAAFDRAMINRVQSKQEPQDEESGKAKREDPQANDPEVPALDPDVYDEAVVKRFEYDQKRIDALEAQLQDLVQERQSGFDEWFDGVLTDLGCDTADEEKCQAIFKAYGAICDAFGTQPTARDKAMAERAYAAMYPQDVFKQKQRQTVDRLRDAQGKFLSKSPATGGPPTKKATDEEVHEGLVASVSAYLKEQGVQMSGY